MNLARESNTYIYKYKEFKEWVERNSKDKIISEKLYNENEIVLENWILELELVDINIEILKASNDLC
jgi:hypothetical protein